MCLLSGKPSATNATRTDLNSPTPSTITPLRVRRFCATSLLSQLFAIPSLFERRWEGVPFCTTQFALSFRPLLTKASYSSSVIASSSSWVGSDFLTTARALCVFTSLDTSSRGLASGMGDSLDGASSAFKDSINAITRVSAVRRSANFLIGFEPEFAL